MRQRAKGVISILYGMMYYVDGNELWVRVSKHGNYLVGRRLTAVSDCVQSKRTCSRYLHMVVGSGSGRSLSPSSLQLSLLSPAGRPTKQVVSGRTGQNPESAGNLHTSQDRDGGQEVGGNRGVGV